MKYTLSITSIFKCFLSVSMSLYLALQLIVYNIFYSFQTFDLLCNFGHLGFSGGRRASAVLHSKRRSGSAADRCVFKHQPLQDTEGLLLLVRVHDGRLLLVRIIIKLHLIKKPKHYKIETKN